MVCAELITGTCQWSNIGTIRAEYRQKRMTIQDTGIGTIRKAMIRHTFKKINKISAGDNNTNRETSLN